MTMNVKEREPATMMDGAQEQTVVRSIIHVTSMSRSSPRELVSKILTVKAQDHANMELAMVRVAAQLTNNALSVKSGTRKVAPDAAMILNAMASEPVADGAGVRVKVDARSTISASSMNPRTLLDMANARSTDTAKEREPAPNMVDALVKLLADEENM
jgi:hypothetical protein